MSMSDTTIAAEDMSDRMTGTDAHASARTCHRDGHSHLAIKSRLQVGWRREDPWQSSRQEAQRLD